MIQQKTAMKLAIKAANKKRMNLNIPFVLMKNETDQWKRTKKNRLAVKDKKKNFLAIKWQTDQRKRTKKNQLALENEIWLKI